MSDLNEDFLDFGIPLDELNALCDFYEIEEHFSEVQPDFFDTPSSPKKQKVTVSTFDIITSNLFYN